MSGYDRSPDYGGPEPGWRDTLKVLLVMAAVGAVFLLALRMRG